MPLATPSHGYNRSGARSVDTVSAIPSSSTPNVWVTVTASAIRASSRRDARLPAIRAAITVLPCPGANACTVPSPTASATASRPMPNDSARRPASSVKRAVSPLPPGPVPPGDTAVLSRPSRGSTAGGPPGRTRNVALVTSDGLDSGSAG